MTVPDPTQGIKEFLTVSQTGLALAGALGFTAVGTTFWRWATRRADERFLIALANHEQAVARADKIEEGAEGLNATEKAELMRLASGLREQARNQLRFAMVRLKWEHSRWSEFAPALGAFGLIFLFGSFIPYYLGEEYLVWFQGLVLASLILLALVPVWVTIVRGEVQNRWIKELRGSAKNPTGTEPAPPALGEGYGAAPASETMGDECQGTVGTAQ